MNKMDELFKRKLEGHAVPPPAGGWEKIESELEKKSKPFIWWRVAAAILLVSTVGWWIYISRTDSPTNKTEYAEGKTLKTVPKSEEKKPTRQAEREKTVSTLADHKTKATKPVSSPAKSDDTQKAASATIIDHNTDNTVATNATPDIETASTAVEPTKSTMSTASAEKPIVLEFKLEPIAQDVIATAQAEKKSLKTVLMDLKNGETTLNFQALKENLFAFNHKKPKPIETRE